MMVEMIAYGGVLVGALGALVSAFFTLRAVKVAQAQFLITRSELVAKKRQLPTSPLVELGVGPDADERDE